MGCHFLLQRIFPSYQPRDGTSVSCLAGRFFSTAPPGKPWVIRDFVLLIKRDFLLWGEIHILEILKSNVISQHIAPFVLIVQLLSCLWLFVTRWTAAHSCPSPSPGVCSGSCPLSQWCYLTISSSVAPLSFCLPSFPASGSFLSLSSSHPVARVSEFQLKHQSFQWIFILNSPIGSSCQMLNAVCQVLCLSLI